MAGKVAIGIQDYRTLIKQQYFYIDKTHFIKEWWESGDAVTLITRPRRFGKTLNMSMLDYFFSYAHCGEEELFYNMDIWKDGECRNMQGQWPVLFLSFANVKETDYRRAYERICRILYEAYLKFDYIRLNNVLSEERIRNYEKCLGLLECASENAIVADSLRILSELLYEYHGKKVIILLDEYDTPMQEAYVNHYWGELASFTRNLFNSTFKTNFYLERAIMTGITRVSRESMFSDLNNLQIVTTTSSKYADCFGFTESEVFHAMEELGFENKEEVRKWYDGFSFGKVKHIYNPWSVINYFDSGILSAWWTNTSSNHLVGKLVREGSLDMKQDFEELLKGSTIHKVIDEQVAYDQLDGDDDAVWSLLLASGYLKLMNYTIRDKTEGDFMLTNYEVQLMFQSMVKAWFKPQQSNYNSFVKALLIGDRKAMNTYMNRVALSTFSSFDTGNHPSASEPERFYHGFVLGLLVELKDRYTILSNRESGFGRYDVILEPLCKEDDGIILEFKVRDLEDEEDLQKTVDAALRQIDEKKYEQILLDKGIKKDNIRKYGFAFEGKKVLIG